MNLEYVILNMFTSLQSFKAYVCLFQDAWIRSVCVILGPAWVSVRGGGASWRKTARSAVTCATVRHWKHPPPTSPAALASRPKAKLSLPHSILHGACGRSITLNSSDIIDQHGWLFNMLVCSSEPLDAVSTPTPPPENVKIKIVPRGKVVGFRCGTKNTRVPPKVR